MLLVFGLFLQCSGNSRFSFVSPINQKPDTRKLIKRCVILLTLFSQVIQENVDWKRSPIKLQKHLRVSVSGRLPDDARGMLHVDFANKFVGGGMLGEGCVQEEILFMLYPELIVSRLFTEELNPKETLIVTGCERFNDSEGYASSFRWVSNHDDTGNRDMWSRRPFEVVAMDALVIMISGRFCCVYIVLKEAGIGGRGTVWCMPL